MNLDFHYYGTYVAACLAGYDKKDAETIAHAAQYVDDSVPERVIDNLLGFKGIPTSHPFSVFIDNHNWSEAFYNELLCVWPVFHFLPGNYKIEDGKSKLIEEYEGVESDKNDYSAWYYDDEAKEQFKLMCLPNTKLGESMVNDLHGKSIVEIGLRMHTLADTWAHMYYSGIPAWFTNGTSGFNRETNFESSDMIGSKYHNSILYLGHAQSEHWPDYPFIKFECKYPWCAKKKSKDNREDFLLAIKQLIEALYCVKNKIDFNIKSEDYHCKLSGENEEIIKKILQNPGKRVWEGVDFWYDQSDAWIENIGQIKINEEKLTVPEKYDPEKWIKEAKVKTDKKSTPYYLFNEAALRHLSFIKNELKKVSIYLDDIPESRITNVKIKDEKNRYISIAKNSYPTFSTETTPVILQLIRPNDSELIVGTIIEIRTTEKTKNDYKYLGGWRGYECVYYYTKKYNPSCQKWIIKQDGVADGKPIDLKNPVQLLNVFWVKEPYLYPYSEKKDTYLKTSGDKYSFTIEEQKLL